MKIPQKSLETMKEIAKHNGDRLTALECAYWLGVMDTTTDALKEVQERRQQLEAA